MPGTHHRDTSWPGQRHPWYQPVLDGGFQWNEESEETDSCPTCVPPPPVCMQTEVLPQLQLEQAQMAADRAARSQARRQSGVGVGGGSAAKGRPPGAVGNRTPLPKEFGRHSIAVVR